MIQQVPIVRHQKLQPLSHDHHHALLLCWKIKTGFKNHVSVERIKSYCNWFYLAHVYPHFKLEEQLLFPVLGMEHALIQKAMAEHRRLIALFEDKTDIAQSLQLIVTELEAHIRFEERILFAEVQKNATEDTLQQLEFMHEESKPDIEWPDPFWEIKP